MLFGAVYGGFIVDGEPKGVERKHSIVVDWVKVRYHSGIIVDSPYDQGHKRFRKILRKKFWLNNSIFGGLNTYLPYSFSIGNIRTAVRQSVTNQGERVVWVNPVCWNRSPSGIGNTFGGVDEYFRQIHIVHGTQVLKPIDWNFWQVDCVEVNDALPVWVIAWEPSILPFESDLSMSVPSTPCLVDKRLTPQCVQNRHQLGVEHVGGVINEGHQKIL